VCELIIDHSFLYVNNYEATLPVYLNVTTVYDIGIQLNVFEMTAFSAG